jgi:pSer/pThr/pTyr-binding forkhead associated (FHA) protein
MAKSYALRFISGKYQGGEFPLLPDREIVIGRSSDLDMILGEDMVSRKHAKISTKNAQLITMDLGSTNATFINGEKIKKTRLKEGDRILVGTSILKVIQPVGAQSGPADEGEARRELEARGRERPDQSRSAMSGSLEEVPVPDLLQLFSTSRRTGVLHIRSAMGYGKIFLRNGNTFYASIDDDHELGPKKAFFRIVGWETGTFEFARPDDEETSFVLELEDSTEELLMEASRQLDEFRRISHELPSPQEGLELPHPMDAPLADLQPLELEVLQLCYNFGASQEVLDRSTGTDYETATALLTLLSQGYVIRGG